MAQQTRKAMTSVVKALRSDSDVADALYVDTDVPAAASDRTRVYPGSWAKVNEFPVEIAVQPLMSNSSTSKTVVSRAYLVECAVVAKEPWFERWQTLSMHDIFDAISSVTILAPAANLTAQGMNDGSDGIEVESDTARRVLSGRWQYQTATTRY